MRKTWLVSLAVAFGFVGQTFAVKAAPTLEGQGINRMGHQIIDVLQKRHGNENIFISPFSLHEAMSMVYAGAEGPTQAELEKALGLGNNASADNLATAYSIAREHLQTADPKVKLEIANSMWGNSDQKVRFAKDFVELNRRGHDATVLEKNFQDAAFVGEVNQWCSEKTHGKVKDVLTGPIPEDQLFYLINAIYFKGAWAVEFDKKATTEETFSNRTGKKAQAKLMARRAEFEYAETNDLQAVKLPYGETNQFSMVLYLPKQKAQKAFFADISKNISELNFSSREGSVLLPRFKMEFTEDKFVEVFQAMGMNRVFSDDSDLDGIAEGEHAKINQIIHKAVVEVNEEGTEAAAVTIVGGVRATSVRVDKPFEFKADHPFYFEIVDETQGINLFSGILNNI